MFMHTGMYKYLFLDTTTRRWFCGSCVSVLNLFHIWQNQRHLPERTKRDGGFCRLDFSDTADLAVLHHFTITSCTSTVHTGMYIDCDKGACKEGFLGCFACAAQPSPPDLLDFRLERSCEGVQCRLLWSLAIFLHRRDITRRVRCGFWFAIATRSAVQSAGWPQNHVSSMPSVDNHNNTDSIRIPTKYYRFWTRRHASTSGHLTAC
mmetsp:Transcript_14136/g.32721  ORF Transcript_14136/g.32721 Transcript_14136/m.32721 type:complete len:206 (+) Transcript_14136:741-1358(+)